LQRSRHALAQLNTQLKNQRPDVNSARTQVNELRHRLQQCQRHALSQQRQQLSALQTQLELLNPQRTLDRGYAIIRDHKGKLLRSTQSCTRRVWSASVWQTAVLTWASAASRPAWINESKPGDPMTLIA
jgi:exodeoxyribonuclease VII large subunit